MKYHFRIHQDRSGGCWAQGVELTGCRSQADSLDELRTNLREALDIFLSEPFDSKMVFPAPRKRIIETRSVWAVEVEPKVAFAMALRSLRLKKKLTQSQMKAILGIKHLSDYQRLEDPRRANPRLATLKKIKTAFPILRIDDILAA